jgi:tRNA threonylcarbamoyladenosine biosynthesis protein TsaB
MAKDMMVLSADTSCDRFSLALMDKDVIISQFNASSCQRQSSDMLPEIEKLLSRNALDVSDIDCFCVGLGPGSFTGLRIGVTIMRAIALTQKKPIVGIPSIDAIACNALPYKSDICVIIDARQQKVYARFYRFRDAKMYPSGRIMLLGMQELLQKIKKPVLFLGDGIKLCGDQIVNKGIKHENLLAEHTWYPHAGSIGRLGIERAARKGGDDVFTLSPLYVYPKEPQVKLKSKRVSRGRF